MHSEIQIKLLLEAMLEKQHGVARLADRIGIKERSLRNWLKASEKELHHIHGDSIDLILKAARGMGIDPESFRATLVLWDAAKSYDENLLAELGEPPNIEIPFFARQFEFLGQRIASRFGASASVLTSRSNRIRFLVQTGASVVVYKTVRPTDFKPHARPNLLYCVKSTRQIDPDENPILPVMVGDDSEGCSPKYGAMNRFGMPSPPVEVWKNDFRAANEALPAGCLLILSVVGASSLKDTAPELIRGFVKVVEMGIDAGATVVELNLSCPNCIGKEGSLYHNLALVTAICKELGKHPVKKLLKIGFMKERELSDFVKGTAGYVDGYSAINSLSVEGLKDGQVPEPAFGETKSAGLSGKPILRCGLRTVSELSRIRKSQNLTHIKIIGMGGVSNSQDVQSYLDSGADVVMATTAFLSDPYFAIGVRRFLDNQYTSSKLTHEQSVEIARMAWSRATQQVTQECGKTFEDRARINEASLGVFIEWQNRHDEEFALGKRRVQKAETQDQRYFADLIRKRLGRI
jgi:dihydroorotate dehydrogenase